MENKEIKVKVEKKNATLIMCICLFIVFGMNFVCVALQTYAGLNANFYGPLLTILALALYAWYLSKKGKQCKVLTAIFEKDKVILKSEKKEQVIPYKDIQKVKMEVVVSRMQKDRVDYKITIKTKGKNYLYLAGEDNNKKREFDQTELSKIYRELKRRGIKCS